MEWQQIVSFYHVVRLGSFTRAAEATFRTQSALSQQIKNLETELDCRLLERIGRKKIRLTLAGEKLLDFCRHTLEEYDYLVSSIDEMKGHQTGRIRLTAPFNTLYYLLPDYIERYRKRFPGVDLNIMDRPPQSVIDLIREGEVDFGLTMESAVPKGLITRRWKRGDYILVAPKDHPLCKVKKPTVEQLSRYPFILPPPYVKSSIRLKMESLFESHGLACNISMGSSNAFLSIKYTEMGQGLSFFMATEELARQLPPTLKKIPLDHYFEPDYIALIMRKDKLLTMVSQAFVDILFDEGEEEDTAASG